MTRTHVACVNCGKEFVRGGNYHGNYCPECHEAWLSEEPDTKADSDEGPRPFGHRSPSSVESGSSTGTEDESEDSDGDSDTNSASSNFSANE
ncbi:hypothetical protein [Haloquadratum walsbyi]|jgi:predicted  nucleic acid-binding Zn-ribbon protein|uniref:Small CPxCG-related zinc finger protein n=1 Tax=Haloquadratum walsbyi J07HQW2 TaxID=1238425 RepID=U1NG88_9EURY|nr:hypothetical protein [Haloquadratum walsbyi]ERG96135.1 MAG: hypothetical protein J07HQW2_02604 [Haloquadratum walsbyi J07HQW2]